MPLHLLHVQNLSAQGQYGLEVAVASLLGAASCGVTLDEEYLAVLRVLVRAVGQLAGQSASAHGVLALHALAGLACCYACRGGQHHLLADEACLLRVLLQVVGQRFAHGLVHGAGDLAVAQLRLCLSLELGLGHLDAYDGRQALAEVLAGNLNLRLLNLLRYLRVGIGIFLQRARQGHAEAHQVRTALDGVDVVHIGVDVLRVVGVVHHGHLDGHALLLGLQVDDVIEEVCAVAVDVAHEFLQSLLGVEHLRLAHVALFVGPFVGQGDGDAGVQVCQLAHALGYGVVFKFRRGEDGGVGPELLACARQLGVAYDLHVVEWLSLLVFLLVYVAVAEHLRLHVRGECVDAAHAHAVQSA